MADDSFERYMAELKDAVGLRAAEWWLMAKERGIWYAGLLPGWLNNNFLLANPDPTTCQALKEFICVKWTDFVLDHFIRHRKRGAASGLRMGIAHSIGGGHTFAVIWRDERNTSPIVSGTIVDPWLYQRWHTLPTKEALFACWPSAYRGFAVSDRFPLIEFGLVLAEDGHRKHLADAGGRKYNELNGDQERLYDAWFQYLKVQEAGAPFG
ncbi:MAG: hypothetical protein HY744_21495 [Deltaproteobacteria bacterium]|nr:hypothetical protein [Deltaproteobacteria bacterium]